MTKTTVSSYTKAVLAACIAVILTTAVANGFHLSSPTAGSRRTTVTKSVIRPVLLHRTTAAPLPPSFSRGSPTRNPATLYPTILQSRLQAEADARSGVDSSSNGGSNNDKKKTSSSAIQTVRDELRKLTGFSFTVFRKTLRGITGISLTAIYASTIAATGLWIRKITSVILSVFPSGFRYFLQPFLVAYYGPLFILRSLTGPVRKRARAKHEQVVDAWKDAVEYAERTEQDGYWPVIVSPDDGCFELQAPPSVPPLSSTSEEVDTTESDSVVVDNSQKNQKELQQERAELADAVAESVDRAMDIVQEEAQKK
mmetsp:Transcript_55293/g.134305  ORF Transcript_55293/g.134305 Transcript_55293/m.134305 type:complete len:312 (+) Transcript_55293:324-1259(+)